MKVTLFVIAAFLATALAAASPDAVQMSSRDRADLLRVAAAVRAAILKSDTTAFLQFVSPSHGLVCTDSNYQIAEVEKYLRDKRSYLYLSLFNSKQFATRCGKGFPSAYPAVSDKTFFERSRQSGMDITFAAKGYAEVTFQAGGADLYPRRFEFHKDAKGWKLVGGITIGVCECG
jgi:hypothetical protein